MCMMNVIYRLPFLVISNVYRLTHHISRLLITETFILWQVVFKRIGL